MKVEEHSRRAGARYIVCERSVACVFARMCNLKRLGSGQVIGLDAGHWMAVECYLMPSLALLSVIALNTVASVTYKSTPVKQQQTHECAS
jgi:hypothetical protein